LALRNPDVDFILIGKNDGEMSGFPNNVVNPWPADVPRAPWVEAGVGDCAICGGQHDGLRLNNRVSLEAEEYVISLAAQLDGMIMHVGQHGVTHRPIPAANTSWKDIVNADPGACGAQLNGDASLDQRLTKPYVWARNYGSATVRALNAFSDVTDGRGPVVWIVTDPRNYLKARDVKWPTGEDDVLAQYAYSRTAKHERYQDPRLPSELGFGDWVRPLRSGEVWESRVTYRYGGIEMMILPDDWGTWGPASFEQRLPVGVASTSFAKNIPNNERRRSQLIRDYVLKAFPDAEVWGKWDEGSLRDVPPGTVQLNDPGIFPELLNRWRVTISLPALGSSWTVAKPFQTWAANVVTFMVGRLDDHGFVLPTRRRVKGVPAVADGLYSIRSDWTEDELTLARWARVDKPEEFHARAGQVAGSRELYDALTRVQRTLLRRRWNEHLVETKIERKLGL
jgi:hypothetical protein